MRLFEYQAKAEFAKAGITIPKNMLVSDIAQVAAAIDEIGFPCVLKAQVLQGGRGKAGLIKIVNSSPEAQQAASALFSSPVKVKKILVEEAVDAVEEIYLAITIEPSRAGYLLMGCREGGMDIETIAGETPEKIVRENIDINMGIQPFQIANFLYELGIPREVMKPAGKLIANLYHCFKQRDAELAEINPLFITRDNRLIAGDGKLSIDDNAFFRQSGYEITREYFDSDVEYEAYREGIPYLLFDGDISLMCAGAGLTNAIYDLIHYHDGSVSSYCEFGGPNYRKAVKAMELALKSPSKVILIVTFGTIARADIMAQGVVDAIARLKPDRPIVTCIRGTNEEKAREILKKAGLTPIPDTEEAVKRAVELSALPGGNQ